MEPGELSRFYDTLKQRITSPADDGVKTYNVTPGPNGEMSPGACVWRNKVANNCEKLKDGCRKRLIVDIYTKILPLDNDYIDGHQGQMDKDVDCMLQCKNMTPTQYLTSCSTATKAPLVEYMLWATDRIGKSYMEAEEKVLKDAQEDGVDLSEPVEPSTDDADVQQQLVDVKQDPEYTGFIDKLKEKTVKKIVSDISKLIEDKKEEKDMSFNTAPAEAPVGESVVFESLNYMHKALWNQGEELSESTKDNMIALAIREATLAEMDNVFKQEHSSPKYGHGYVVNESSLDWLPREVTLHDGTDNLPREAGASKKDNDKSKDAWSPDDDAAMAQQNGNSKDSSDRDNMELRRHRRMF